METRNNIIKAYVFLRENNQTIPSEDLEMIKNSALAQDYATENGIKHLSGEQLVKLVELLEKITVHAEVLNLNDSIDVYSDILDSKILLHEIKIPDHA